MRRDSPATNFTEASLSRQTSGLLAGSLFVFVGLLGRTGLLMLFELVAARWLGPADYGVFSLAFTVIVVLSSLSVLGLPNSLRRFISYHAARGELAEVRGLIAFGLLWPAVVGTLVGVTTWLAAGRIANEVFHKPEVEPVLRALALVVPFWATRRLATMVFSGYRKPSFKILVEDLLEPAVRVLAAVTIAVAGLGAVQLGHGNLVGFLLVAVVSWALVLRGASSLVGPGPLRWPGRELVSFSAPLVVSELAAVVLTWAGVLLLGLLSDETQVGIFRAVSQPPILASAILTSFNFIYLPLATELFVKDDRRGWNRANAAVARWSLSLAFPVGAICMLYPSEVIRILFGTDYLIGVTAMQLLGAAYLFHAACGFTGLNLIIAGRTTLQMTATLASLVTNIVLCFLWIPSYGALGAAAAVLVTTLVRNLFNLVTMRLKLGLSPFDGRYAALAGVQMLALGALYAAVRLIGLPGIASMVIVALGVLPLAALLGYLLGVFDRTDLDLVARYRESKRNRDGR